MSNAVLRHGSDGIDRLWLWCPGCQDLHMIYVAGGTAPWDWDGDTVAPTISPSILVRYPTPEPHPRNVCHSFVRAGVWEFLGDCTHALAGQHVPMSTVEPRWPWITEERS